MPDGLTNNLPLFFIRALADLIAFLHLDVLIIFLSLTLIFINFCGTELYTLNILLADLPFLKANKTSKATKSPSPVVANFPSII